MVRILIVCLVAGIGSAASCSRAVAQQTSNLQRELEQLDPAELADEARRFGDPQQGALVFFQPHSTCAKCHDEAGGQRRLAPDLAELAELGDVGGDLGTHLVESILHPSRQIRDGFQTVNVFLLDGRIVSGVLIDETPQALNVATVDEAQPLRLDFDQIEDWQKTELSTMPPQIVNLLPSKSDFLDLLAYVIDVAENGKQRQLELRPPDAWLALPPIPEYESHVDHAGLIARLDQTALQRGEQIYNMRCVNCHGDLEQPGSLPTSLRFAEGRFKNGSDPYAMYRTITHGFGMMNRQDWLVPRQKYDVIHYIREHFVRPHNPSQYTRVDDEYLTRLPVGDTFGPPPKIETPWTRMDYGPVLMNTIEVGDDARNFAYKGIAVRLDPGPGGVAEGRHWMLYDHDTLRMSAAWSRSGQTNFIDWHGIHFDGQHNSHPRLAGTVQFQTRNGPGWDPPPGKTYVDQGRVRGRDDRLYGPLPDDWVQFKGRYDYGQHVVLHYSVQGVDVLESPGLQSIDNIPVFVRNFDIQPHEQELVVQLCDTERAHRVVSTADDHYQEVWWLDLDRDANAGGSPNPWDGRKYAQCDTTDFDFANLFTNDFSIIAQIQTDHDGTIACWTEDSNAWVPNGQSLFIRDGRLVFDIGWVGAVTGRHRVADGQPHVVAMTWDRATAEIRLFVDGEHSGSGNLRPREPLTNPVFRIAYTAENFPADSYFQGELFELDLFDRALRDADIKRLAHHQLDPGSPDSRARIQPAIRWQKETLNESTWPATDGKTVAQIDSLLSTGPAKPLMQLACSLPTTANWDWNDSDPHRLSLTIPPSTTRQRLSVYLARIDEDQAAHFQLPWTEPAPDLNAWTQGGGKRWPQILETQLMRGTDSGPLAVDVLQRPVDNPWNCRMRLTGLDFFSDTDRLAVCSWDGSVFLVSGLQSADGQLTWQRIASGLFQPLGLKIIDDEIYVGCRDQLVKLHDLNGDREIDFYECINNDHQVTDHFHEFAMGLQTDDEGNFYYAKSARHALPALVPHHGTLLKVHADGGATDIVANGFRAANGVCLNPDGTFFVTDQEGHWTPKNRINLVKPGGFYGNFLGYHDIASDADEAMERPLVWITNEMDRSPGELLWVESAGWGSLAGRLLNLSYGMGQIFLVPFENVDGQVQGGVVHLPLPPFPTGIMRGRFQRNGDLYCCGMFAWSGNQQQPGGLYRVRATGKPFYLPVELQAHQRGIDLEFSAALSEPSVNDTANWAIQVWDLERSANYGSPHLNQRPLPVQRAELLDERRVRLWIDDLQPTRGMEIRYSLRSGAGQPVRGRLHNTIHRLGEVPE